jgi:hypothetical protein
MSGRRRAQGPDRTTGGRVITFVLMVRGVFYLLDVYAKNAKEDLTSADKHEIRRRIETLAAEA